MFRRSTGPLRANLAVLNRGRAQACDISGSGKNTSPGTTNRMVSRQKCNCKSLSSMLAKHVFRASIVNLGANKAYLHSVALENRHNHTVPRCARAPKTENKESLNPEHTYPGASADGRQFAACRSHRPISGSMVANDSQFSYSGIVPAQPAIPAPSLNLPSSPLFSPPLRIRTIRQSS